MFFDDLEEALKMIGIVILIVVIIVGTVFGGAYLGLKGQRKADNKTWNNGICVECEKGYYQYKEAIGHKSSSSFLYECDNCGHMIELQEVR